MTLRSLLLQVARFFSPHTARGAGDPPASPNPFLSDPRYLAAHEQQQLAQDQRNTRAWHRATAAKRQIVTEYLAKSQGKAWPA